MEQRSTPKLLLSHLLAMLVASMLTLALSGCGGDTVFGSTPGSTPESTSGSTPESASAGSASPGFAASQSRSMPIVVSAADGEMENAVPAWPDPATTRDTPTRRNTQTAHAGGTRPEVFAPSDAIRVRRALTALDVVDREPVDSGWVFSQDEFAEQLYAYFELANYASNPARVFVVFVSPSGIEHGLVSLDIPAHAPRWRTWAFTRAVTQEGQEGDWRVELRHPDGTVLSSEPFEVEAGDGLDAVAQHIGPESSLVRLEATADDEYEPADC